MHDSREAQLDYGPSPLLVCGRAYLLQQRIERAMLDAISQYCGVRAWGLTMAWRFVTQPNGLLARFSYAVDDFTHVNLTREQAQAIAEVDYALSPAEARCEIMGAIEDRDPRTGIVGDGLSRWRDSIFIIGLSHGRAAALAYESRLENTAEADTPVVVAVAGPPGGAPRP